jgi:hypothetical protein
LFHRQNCGRWQLKAERAVPFTSGSARILRFAGRKGLNEASRAHLSAALRWYAHAPALLCCRPTDRPICNARVPRAIRQSFDWLVSAEAEVFGARVADWPAAFPLAELEQRASASVVDRDVFSRRLRPRERRPQHLMLSEDVQAGRCGRQVLGVFGRASLAARLCSNCLPIKSLGRDRPRRFILPMTALRVTPISRAVWRA